MTVPAHPPRHPALDVLRLCARAGLWAGGAILFIISAMVLAEVIVRKFFDGSIQGVDELAGYGMAIGFALAMPDTILRGTHVSVDLIYQKVPTPAKLVLNVFGILAFGLFMAVLSYRCVLLAWSSYATGLRSSILGLTLSLPQSLWAAGLAFATIVLFAILFHVLVELARGNHDTIQDLVRRSEIHRATDDENIQDVLAEAQEADK